jgi:hypothetical protein
MEPGPQTVFMSLHFPVIQCLIGCFARFHSLIQSHRKATRPALILPPHFDYFAELAFCLNGKATMSRCSCEIVYLRLNLHSLFPVSWQFSIAAIPAGYFREYFIII